MRKKRTSTASAPPPPVAQSVIEALPPEGTRVTYARLVSRGFNCTLLITEGDLKGEYLQLRDCFVPNDAKGDDVLTIAVGIEAGIG